MPADQQGQQPEVDRLREENERLRAELSRLHAGVRFSTMATGASVTGHLTGTVAGKSTGTVMGIEEMILQVGPDRSIGYINAPMAKLLGIRERRSVLGEPLASWDKGPFGEGTLRSVVDAALATPETVAIERVCPGLDESLLR